MRVSLGQIKPALVTYGDCVELSSFGAFNGFVAEWFIYYYRLQDRSDRDLTVVLGGLHGSEQHGQSQAGT
jgi:hypothetical protein